MPERVKEGFLQKTNTQNVWQKRWFILLGRYFGGDAAAVFSANSEVLHILACTLSKKSWLLDVQHGRHLKLLHDWAPDLPTYRFSWEKYSVSDRLSDMRFCE